MTDTGKPAIGRREQRKAERRAAIVAVATRAFVERGYAGTSLSAIADELGGSKGTLWSYFASKEELFAAVVDAAADSFRSTATAILRADDAVERVLTGFVEAFAERITSPAAIAMQRLIIGETGRAAEIGAIFYARAPALTHQLMTDYLSTQIARGALRPGDAAAASELLFRLCAGGLQEEVLWGVAKPTRAAIREEARFVVSHFLTVWGNPAVAGKE